MTIVLLACLGLTYNAQAKGHKHPPKPEDVAKKLIEEFDENDDFALSEEELTKALTALQERRMKRHAHKNSKNRGNQPEDLPTPEELAINLIEEFDGNSDEALDETELAEGLHEMRRTFGPPHCRHKRGGPQSGNEGAGAFQ